MNASSPWRCRPWSRLHDFSLVVFVAIVTLQGTYFRLRPADLVPELDWLVLARLSACLIGLAVGIALIPQGVKWGAGAKLLTCYSIATLLSAAGSPLPAIVAGYAVLLLGAGFLVIGMVYHASDSVQIAQIERVWYLTMTVLVLKDALTGMLFPEMQTDGEEILRLGMGVTHATTLSLSAGIVFWLSFRQGEQRHAVVCWLWRAFLVYVLIAAVSRVSIVAFLAGGMAFLFIRTRDRLLRWIIALSVSAAALFFLLSLSFELEWSKSIDGYLQRGQDLGEMATLTGRTFAWRHAFGKSFESPLTGHGYCVSRFTLGPLPDSGFQPAHCHNELLEVFFSCGILGFLPFLLMLTYSLKWFKGSSRRILADAPATAANAVIVMTMLLISSLFEARLGDHIEPVSLLFFLYLLTLDREGDFPGNNSLRGEAARSGVP